MLTKHDRRINVEINTAIANYNPTEYTFIDSDTDEDLLELDYKNEDDILNGLDP